jgi:hypothetical protein
VRERNSNRSRHYFNLHNFILVLFGQISSAVQPIDPGGKRVNKMARRESAPFNTDLNGER